MPSPNELYRRSAPPKRWAHFLKNFSGATDAGRALGSTGVISLDSVPTQLPDGRYVHIEGLVGAIVADVDSDGTPSADLAAERVLGSFANFRWSALSGKIPLFEGGDVDARVVRFLEVMRQGAAAPPLPDDAGNASAADIFPDGFYLFIRFPSGGDREGGRRADGVIFRGLFQDLLGEDAFRYDVLAENNAASIGAEAGVTLNSFTQVKWFALCYADPFPILDAIPRVRYNATALANQVVQPIDTLSRSHRVEYAGFRQREEDTEGLTFANAGNLTIRHAAFSPQVGRSMADYEEGLKAILGNAGRAGLADRYLEIQGHLPLVYSGPTADRDHWGRAPFEYELSSLGSSRTSVRLLRSEVHTWSDEQIAEAAREIGVPVDRIDQLRESVRAVQIDPQLLPRRINIRG